ncbi:Protein MAIN-LIKE 2 [Glycine max]|nr:Protein MAIN-LIKE 2 [Glycine max]
MVSSSSCSSHIKIKSGPIDGNVLWMQPKHVSEHIWDGKEDRKLYIRRAVPTYQGEEEIPEQIFPFLRQSDGLPLIGPTNLDWADLCEELLGVRPQEGEIKGSVVKLSWLTHHFAQINNDYEEQIRRFARAWILRFIGGVLFVDKSSNKVSLRYLQFLRDFEECGTYAWGAVVLERCAVPSIIKLNQSERWLRRENQHIDNEDVRVFRRKLDIMKRHEFVWEPYTTTVVVSHLCTRKCRVVRGGATNLFPSY